MTDIDRRIEDLQTSIESLEKTDVADIKEQHLSVLKWASETLSRIQSKIAGEELANAFRDGTADRVEVPRQLKLGKRVNQKSE